MGFSLQSFQDSFGSGLWCNQQDAVYHDIFISNYCQKYL